MQETLSEYYSSAKKPNTKVYSQLGHSANDLVQLFAKTFYRDYATCLIGGAEEPLYQASVAVGNGLIEHHIYFRHDYFASALHEIAHWCIAGEQRRLQDDYGYWYSPDGRSLQQQQLFEEVEAAPQAIECMFCEAAQFPFQVSVDNLAQPDFDSRPFQRKVSEQVVHYKETGLPIRAELFLQALQNFYGSTYL